MLKVSRILVAKAAEGPWLVIKESTGKVHSEHANKGQATKTYNKVNAEDGGYSMVAKSHHEEMKPKK